MATSAVLGSQVTRLAGFVSSGDVPPAARHAAGLAVLDTVGVALAGAHEPVARHAQTLSREEGASGSARVFGLGLTTAPSWAALANGAAAHALDFDDMCWVSMAHPSAPLVAAAFAMADTGERSGRDVLDGYVVGFETAAVLGRVMNPRHYANGWHCTSTIGTVAAAATAARVAGLDADQSARALEIAASMASGVKANFGTMVKPLQVGLAGRNGVLAARLAALGTTAAEAALDGDQGMLAAMQGSGHDLTEAMAALGTAWEIVDGGITMKLYPSCAATHPTIDTLLDLRREGVSAEAIESVDIRVDAVTPTVLVYDRPRTGLEGKFSLPFCAAAALARGGVGIETFEADTVEAPEVRQLIERVTMRVDPALGVDAPPLTQARITVRTRDGRQIERAVDGARGYPDRPPSLDERRSKFLECAARVLDDAAATAALAGLEDLEAVERVPELTATLAPASSPSS